MAILKRWNRPTRHVGLALLAAFVRRRRVPAETIRAVPAGRILVVRQDDRIGNLLFVTPLLNALHELFPRAEIDVVVSSRYREVLAHQPAVRRLLVVDRRGMRRRPFRIWGDLRALRRVRYDLVFDAKPGPSLSGALVVLLARHAWSIGFDHAYSRAIHNHAIAGTRPHDTHESVWLHELVSRIWSVPVCGPMTFGFPPGREPGPPAGRVVLHVGGHGRKRVPAAVLVPLIRSILDAGHRLEVLGGGEEAAMIATLHAEVPGLPVTRPPDVVELARRIASAALVICPDTGALHIASALDVPTINLCPGNADPAFAPRSARQVTLDFREPGVVEGAMRFLREVLPLPDGDAGERGGAVGGAGAGQGPGSSTDRS